MPKQPVIPGLHDAVKKKVTRREQFLSEMDQVVPWGRLLALIAPHYPKDGAQGRAAPDGSGDDAAGQLPAELVRAERPDGRRDAL
jgi:hypothetical protein